VTVPAGQATLRIDSSRPIVDAALGGENAEPAAGPNGGQRVEFAFESTGDAIDLSLTIRTGAGEKPPTVQATYRAEGATKTAAMAALLRDRLAVPWAPAPTPAPGPPPPSPNLAGGDRVRGQAVFFGETARCSNCHQIRGEGKSVGPDLTGLAGRDRAAVFRDIAEPSAAIRPDYVPFTVALKDGRVVVGIVRAEGADAIRVTDTDAKATLIPRTEIEELRPSATSIMPVGLVGAIGEDKLRDLLAFLTAPPPPAKP
jgi:putative heme-binding domain-containing protein